MRCSALPSLPRLLAVFALAACSHNGAAFVPAAGGSPEGIQNATRATQYTILYAFKGVPDGAHPSADLIVYKGNLYGTTI
ncbi:MAG: hypothetical protein JOZ01_04895, partial [Candidatus Eremiobacteraeota bacterium]|nr:hypothetical protein [Candidatus Eremiobacteraeota bacterium]